MLSVCSLYSFTMPEWIINSRLFEMHSPAEQEIPLLKLKVSVLDNQRSNWNGKCECLPILNHPFIKVIEEEKPAFRPEKTSKASN